MGPDSIARRDSGFAARGPSDCSADKKTIQGKVHFVLPVRIGEVRVVSGIDDGLVLESIDAVLR